jgi:hypothetical protein
VCQKGWMGNQRSSEHLQIPVNPNREVFVIFDSYHHWSGESRHTHHSFLFIIRYQRYEWKISKRYREIVKLDDDLYNFAPEKLELIKVPRKYPKILWSHDDPLLLLRGQDIAIYLQMILDDHELWNSRIVKEFLWIGEV